MEGKPKNLHGSETILLAEDHDSIRELTRQSLTRLGYQVLAAADGRQALRLAELERPDLAVLDVVMPHLGGAATRDATSPAHGIADPLHQRLFGERKQRRGPGAGLSLSSKAVWPDVAGQHDPGNPGWLMGRIPSSATTG